jgi:D-serine dehydratase
VDTYGSERPSSDIERPFESWMKGIPDFTGVASSQDIERLNLNLLSQQVSFPCAVVKQSVLQRNEKWMTEFARRSGVRLCPHGKTSMSPELFARQIANGAWGITAATSHQLRVMRKCGISRIFYANQIVDPTTIRYLIAELARDPAFEFYCLVDSRRGVDILAAQATGASRPINVLLEVGQNGGRTGVRTLVEAIDVARAVRERPELVLAGVELFEFTVAGSDLQTREYNMAVLFNTFVDTTRELDRLGFFDSKHVILSAGGSAYFDMAAAAMSSVELTRPIIPLLRSGCYLTSDEAWLPGFIERMRSRSAIAADIPEPPMGAIEVWAYIQSRPEQTRAFATLGKRDVSHDIDLPRVVRWFRPGLHTQPVAMSNGTVIEALNDQHAYLKIPADSPLVVGDMIAVGISHPCTTFDKWRGMLLVDDEYNVIGALSTRF